MVPKEVHILISGPMTMVPQIKSNFSEVVKLIVLRQGDYTGLSKWANTIISILPYGRRQEVSEDRRCYAVALQMEKEVTSQRKSCPSEGGKDKEMGSSMKPPEGMQP